MIDDKADLFDTDPDLDPAQALEAMEVKQAYRWEGTLAELLYAVTFTLAKHLGQEQADLLAPEVVLSAADRVGGGLLYFPKAAELKRAIRDARMATLYWQEGWSIERLMRRYELTQARIYAILARQRELRRRNSPDMFGFDKPASEKR